MNLDEAQRLVGESKTGDALKNLEIVRKKYKGDDKEVIISWLEEAAILIDKPPFIA